MSGPIVLLTDFGLSDAYVGTMKGVILGINPAATIVDLSHGVPPQDVGAGAFLLGSSYRYFPPASIFVAVVDPGVGGARRAIALKTPGGTFVAPDNGLLTPIVRDFGISGPARHGRASLAPRGVPPGEVEVYGVELTNSEYLLPRVSATFHGRDIFAPVAAHLSRGIPLAFFGPALHELVVRPEPKVARRDGEIVGEIVFVDRFGNAITNLTPEDLAGLATPVVKVAGHEIAGVSHHYAEREGPLALIGSNGHLEIAVNGGNAAKQLGLKAGDRVVVAGGT